MKLVEIIKCIIPYGIVNYINNNFTFNILNSFRKRFKLFEVRDNSILICEFTGFHGEVIPGLAKYSLDLGYNVDIAIRKYRNKNKTRNDHSLFSCFSDNNKVRNFYLSGINMNFLLRTPISKLYKQIIITTITERVLRIHLYKVDLFKLKPVCILHNYDPSSIEYFKTNRIISIVKINCINRKPPYVVNTHYFGDYRVKEKSTITTFTTLYSKDLLRRNIYLLFDACCKLLKKGITNFNVKIIGGGISIPDNLKENIKLLGYLNFNIMYNELHESDFLLALIDQASVKYTNKASGTYGLSYGFLKPIILHSKFSEISNFNNQNSILYDDNDDLYLSMEKCINMHNNEYLVLVSSLQATEKELYSNSLNNLKLAFESSI